MVDSLLAPSIYLPIPNQSSIKVLRVGIIKVLLVFIHHTITQVHRTDWI
jgi:hypothetical protein